MTETRSVRELPRQLSAAWYKAAQYHVQGKSDLREDWWPTTLRGWSARPWGIDPAAARFARSSFAGDTTAYDGASGTRSHIFATRSPSIRLAKTAWWKCAKTVGTAPRDVTRNPACRLTRRGAFLATPAREHPKLAVYIDWYGRAHCTAVWRFCNSERRVKMAPTNFRLT